MTDQSVAPDPKTLLHWEVEDYLFQHNFNAAEQAGSRLQKKGGKFQFRMEWKRDQGLTTTYQVPDETAVMEFALAMSPFLLEESERSATAWFEFLKEIAGEDYQAFLDESLGALLRAKDGDIPILVNDKRLRAAEVYNEIARNVVFVGDMDAARFLADLQKSPVLGQMMWMMYHNYCLDVFAILSQVMEYRKAHGIYPPKVARENHCIYCKRTD